MSGKIRLGIFGCGAITRENHLPAAVSHPQVEVAALVDIDVKRAESLRQFYTLNCRVTPDYKVALAEVDAVINALPNFLHAAVTLDALQAGVHVLCEKPLATTAAEARACCEAAAARDVLLAVGMHRRFYESSRILPAVLDEGLLGALQDYDWEEGGAWGWNTASGFYFDRARAGGGVLIDSGVHLLDNLFQWFGPGEVIEYQDDNWGSGIEANCMLALCHACNYGKIRGRVRLSRTFALKNRLAVRGESSRAEIHGGDPDVVVLRRRLGDHEVTMATRLASKNGVASRDPFYKQLDNFIASIRGAQLLASDGWQALQILELVERCYAGAVRIPEPWSDAPGISPELGS
ncbi:MAG: Gfo/Idh/MocA family protein [Terriglobia bacterium]